VSDPEVLRTLINDSVMFGVACVIAFVIWLFCDRRIKVWWGNGGLDIEGREKKS
jgi:hypothetical protein